MFDLERDADKQLFKISHTTITSSMMYDSMIQSQPQAPPPTSTTVTLSSLL